MCRAERARRLGRADPAGQRAALNLDLAARAPRGSAYLMADASFLTPSPDAGAPLPAAQTAPWHPPKKAASFTLARVLPGEQVERCSILNPETGEVLTKHPVPLPQATFLACWGSGRYVATFHDKENKGCGRCAIELSDPAWPTLSA